LTNYRFYVIFAGEEEMPKTLVVLFQERKDEVPVRDWLRELAQSNAKAHVKGREAIRLLEDFGHELRRPHADFLCDGIYELRFRLGHVNHRILYFFHGRTAAVLSSGFTKEAEVPRIEIERASERKRKFLENPEAHTYRGSET
jgi:hypothetical protein